MEISIFAGLGIGAAIFLIIGLFHPAVIKVEYYLGAKYWWIFLLLGIIGIVTSILVNNIFWSSILGVFGFSSFWSVKEILEQEKRVKKGWFPRNPNRKQKSYLQNNSDLEWVAIILYMYDKITKLRCASQEQGTYHHR